MFSIDYKADATKKALETPAQAELVTFTNPGDSVKGEVTGGWMVWLDDLHHEKQKVQRIQLELTDDDGLPRRVTILHTDLKRQVDAQQPILGDWVSITFKDIARYEGGRYYRFELIVNGNTSEGDEAPF